MEEGGGGELVLVESVICTFVVVVAETYICRLVEDVSVTCRLGILPYEVVVVVAWTCRLGVVVAEETYTCIPDEEVVVVTYTCKLGVVPDEEVVVVTYTCKLGVVVGVVEICTCKQDEVEVYALEVVVRDSGKEEEEMNTCSDHQLQFLRASQEQQTPLKQWQEEESAQTPLLLLCFPS